MTKRKVPYLPTAAALKLLNREERLRLLYGICIELSKGRQSRRVKAEEILRKYLRGD